MNGFLRLNWKWKREMLIKYRWWKRRNWSWGWQRVRNRRMFVCRYYWMLGMQGPKSLERWWGRKRSGASLKLLWFWITIFDTFSFSREKPSKSSKLVSKYLSFIASTSKFNLIFHTIPILSTILTTFSFIPIFKNNTLSLLRLQSYFRLILYLIFFLI